MNLHRPHFRFLAILAWITLLLAPLCSGAQPQDPVSIEVVPNRTTADPGENLAVAVVFNVEPSWHLHTNDPKVPKSWDDFPAIPTRILVTRSTGVQVGPIQWPSPSIIKLDLAGTGTPEPYGVFEGRAVAYLPLVLRPDATGAATLELQVSFQVCNDNICLPEKTVAGRAEIRSLQRV
jgi:DsbC/DsbD-like thiol-disulfide interchange protein